MHSPAIPRDRAVNIVSFQRFNGSMQGFEFEFDGPIAELYVAAHLYGGSASSLGYNVFQGVITGGKVNGGEAGHVQLSSSTTTQANVGVGTLQHYTTLSYGGRGVFYIEMAPFGAVLPTYSIGVIGVSA